MYVYLSISIIIMFMFRRVSLIQQYLSMDAAEYLAVAGAGAGNKEALVMKEMGPCLLADLAPYCDP